MTGRETPGFLAFLGPAPEAGLTVRTGADVGRATVADGRVEVVVSGWLDLGGERISTGAAAAEQLAHAYLRRGPAFLDGLHGGYAVLVRDSASDALLVARDAVGEGSLFLADRRGGTVVGTDPAELDELIGGGQLTRSAFLQYLLLNYVMADEWYVAGIRPVPAGVLHRLDASGLHTVRSTTGYPGRDVGDAPPPEPGELATALTGAARRRLGSPAALHLSGGVDTSLIAHGLRAEPGTLRTYGVSYVDDDDRRWSAVVANEVRSRHRAAVLPADGSFLDRVDELAGALGSPVMAIGVPTFGHLGRLISADGADVVLSGVGADHPVVGWGRLARLQSAGVPLDAPGAELLPRCVLHVAPEVLLPYLADPALRREMHDLLDRLRGMAGDRPLPETIEMFHAEHFVPEHLRSARVAHGLHQVRVRHPFLAADVLELGFRFARSQAQAADKRYLRRELAALGSDAAERRGKQQQALSFERFRVVARDRIRERLADSPPLFGLDTGRLARLAGSDAPASTQELRLLWLIYSYLSWSGQRATASRPGGRLSTIGGTR
jgi:asparagine synthetase B (glutamine-hydrolysing)